MGNITVTMPLSEYEGMKEKIKELEKEIEDPITEFRFLLDPNDSHRSFIVDLVLAKEVVKNSPIKLLEVIEKMYGPDVSRDIEELLMSGKPLVEFKQP